MVVGVLQLTLHVPWAESLKDKRSVVKSVKDRLHREHLVAVAEVGHLDALNVAVLAVSAVGTDGKRVGTTLDKVTDKLRTMTDAEVGAVERRVLSANEMGLGEARIEEIDEDAIAAEMFERMIDVDGGSMSGEQPS
ncbi:MAG: DUF503 domain-containing protein [Planctomycetota bacterium]